MDMIESYTLKYNFGEWNARIEKYLNRLLSKSTDYFANQFNNGELEGTNSEYVTMLESIFNIEEYLYYNKNNSNFYNILKSLENINVVSVLPKNNRGIYGQAIVDENVLLISPVLKPSRTLTKQERTRLYLAHELGHYINNEWMKTVIDDLNNRLRNGKLEESQAQTIYNGFALLDESITQNRAEEFAYNMANKPRPSMRDEIRQNQYGEALFDGNAYRTNYDYYGEFQIPTVMFGRTLRGIGKLQNDTEVLNVLSQRALNPNFANRIIQEYSKNGQLPKLFPLLESMGTIKSASYYLFRGNNDVRALNNSRNALNSVSIKSSRLRDYREPLKPEYGDR